MLLVTISLISNNFKGNVCEKMLFFNFLMKLIMFMWEIFGDPFDHAQDECLPRMHGEIFRRLGKGCPGRKAFAIDCVLQPKYC